MSEKKAIWQKIIQVAIAVLSAIAGAIGGNILS